MAAFRSPHLLAVLVLTLAATACTQTKAFKATGDLERPQGLARVLVMPPDVELYELSAGGLLEPRADWTATAETNVHAALENVLETHDAEAIRYRPPGGDLTLFHPDHVQLVKLHGAVGQAIWLHKYNNQLTLPTKREAFDWTLGDGVRSLREDYGADYALFVHLRDSFANSGRVVLIIAAAVLGVGVPGGQQAGFASLVDLDTGDVVWFNVLHSEAGDLRDPERAEQALTRLLNELPL